MSKITCRICGIEKQHNEFYTYEDKTITECKKCASKRVLQRYNNLKDRLRKAKRKFKKSIWLQNQSKNIEIELLRLKNISACNYRENEQVNKNGFNIESTKETLSFDECCKIADHDVKEFYKPNKILTIITIKSKL
jgi:hypothetical protein